jgi:DNA-binding beta-propeller fold protein YncE
VISTATNTVTATIDLGGMPDALAISPDGSTVYVAYLTRTAGAIAEIDTASATLDSAAD